MNADVNKQHIKSGLLTHIASLEMTVAYLSEKLQITELHLQTILNSPAWKLGKPLRAFNLLWWKMKPPSASVAADSTFQSETLFNKISGACKIVHKSNVLTMERIAYIAHWHPDGDITPSLESTITSLSKLGWTICLIGNFDQNLPPSIEVKDSVIAIQKPNFGYDFGSWAVGVNMFEPSFETSEVLFLNDSTVLINKDLWSILKLANESIADLTFLTDSNYPNYHGQSYFIHAKNGLPTDSNFHQFWKNIPELVNKIDVIKHLEIGLTNFAYAIDRKVTSIFRWNYYGTPKSNPCIDNWGSLLNAGIPFLKREVLRKLDKQDLEILNRQIEELHGKNARKIQPADIY